jgi:hypothetical protein
MKHFIRKLKHALFGEHDWVMIAEGEEKTGGMLFGGVFHWSRYECTICHEVSSSATESL